VLESAEINSFILKIMRGKLDNTLMMTSIPFHLPTVPKS